MSVLVEDTGILDVFELVAGAVTLFGALLSTASTRFLFRGTVWSEESLKRLSTSVMVPSMLLESAIEDSDWGVDVEARDCLST